MNVSDYILNDVTLMNKYLIFEYHFKGLAARAHYCALILICFRFRIGFSSVEYHLTLMQRLCQVLINFSVNA